MAKVIEKKRPLAFDDKPDRFPDWKTNAQPIKALTQVILDRRATTHFLPDPVPEEHLHAILKFGAQAPSGYNLQPWRFIVVRDLENKKRLQKAAFNQEKISEAPVVIIALGMKEAWKEEIDAIFSEGVHRGMGRKENIPKQKDGAIKFLSKQNMSVWVTKHVMIAVTQMMLLAEAYGLDTAPMEGFDPEAVRKEFHIPNEAEVVALLAIGYGKGPDKSYSGRFPLEHIVFEEEYGKPWPEKLK